MNETNLDQPQPIKQKGIKTNHMIKEIHSVNFGYEDDDDDEDFLEPPNGPILQEKSNDNDSLQSYSMWVRLSPTEYIASRKINTVKKVEAGYYKFGANSDGNLLLTKYERKNDELLKLPNSIFDEILNDIKVFWKSKDVFSKYKFVHKRGILLYGEAGNGKTSLVNLIADEVINLGGIVYNIQTGGDLELFAMFINVFREIQETTPILINIDDIDALVSLNPSTETLLLNLLDGAYQIENVIYVANTNHPDTLEERILNRPSRFDKRYYITYPDEKTREFYFNKKIHKDDLEKINLQEIVKKTEGLSVAHLGEFIKSVFIFKKDIDVVIKTLLAMKEKVPSFNRISNPTVGGFKK